ncbi:MAG: reverse transcriptase family protein [Myxococcota bacterium]|nr:reverse transcriptase family protein [Myxococcota bacterium]
MSKENQNELVELWNEIQIAGGREAYIRSELTRMGIEIPKRVKITNLRDKVKKARYIALRQKEEEARARINKKIWAAYKMTHIVELGDGIFWKDPAKDFYDVHDREERRQDNGIPELETVSQLVEALNTVFVALDIPTLRWLCYHREVAKTTHYRTFNIPKKTGGTRQISAPMPRLKAIQKWISRNIAEKLATHGSAHGFIVGRSILSNANVHTDSKVVVSMDLKDFFPTFTFRRVKGIFRAAGYLDGIATLLALLCTEAPRRAMKIQDEKDPSKEIWVHVASGDRCLPQGSPASPSLTNAACLRLDRRLMGYARKHGWRYTRYADDLTFSFPNSNSGSAKTDQLKKMVSEIVKSEGFTLHPNKTDIMGTAGQQKVTGLIVNGTGTPRVAKDFRDKLRAAIHNQEEGKPLQEDETINTLMGYASFVFSADPEKGARLLQQLQDLSEE